jgi:hypothetical protein
MKKTIRRAIKERGYIYIPNIFIPYLKGFFNVYSKPFIENFKPFELEYVSTKKKCSIS